MNAAEVMCGRYWGALRRTRGLGRQERSSRCFVVPVALLTAAITALAVIDQQPQLAFDTVEAGHRQIRLT